MFYLHGLAAFNKVFSMLCCDPSSSDEIASTTQHVWHITTERISPAHEIQISANNCPSGLPTLWKVNVLFFRLPIYWKAIQYCCITPKRYPTAQPAVAGLCQPPRKHLHIYEPLDTLTLLLVVWIPCLTSQTSISCPASSPSWWASRPSCYHEDMQIKSAHVETSREYMHVLLALGTCW